MPKTLRLLLTRNYIVDFLNNMFPTLFDLNMMWLIVKTAEMHDFPFFSYACSFTDGNIGLSVVNTSLQTKITSGWVAMKVLQTFGVPRG